jgi:pimeloyl-ACP methyl ester carboxylesterase
MTKVNISTNFDDTNDSSAAKIPKGKRYFRVAFRIVLILLTMIFVMSVIGIGFQSVSTETDIRRYPPPGELIDIGGYRLHIYCTGEGNPTIVLDSGAAGPGLMWSLVQNELAKSNRVCSYDRAGLGWSDKSTTTRTSLNMVEELHILLKNAGIKPPYILVGHSLAGFNVRIYAREYPGDVIGIVLVNAAYEGTQLPTECQAIFNSNTNFASLMQPLTYMGITRIADKLGAFSSSTEEIFGDLPSDLKIEIKTLTIYRPQYWATFVAEISAASEDGVEAKAAGSLGAIPLRVISGSPDVSRIPPEIGCPIQEVIKREKAAQISLATFSSNSDLITCDTCGHYIPMTNPELVVDTIEQLIAK